MALKKIPWLSLLALLGAIGVPFFSITFFSFSEKSFSQWFFVVFICFHSIERVWETFFTTKERRPMELHGDWTLVATTVAYIVLCFLSSVECFFEKKAQLPWGILIGVILYSLAFGLRWWGMMTLGSQWAVHAVGAQKVSKVSIIKNGPYRYIRHPIYLAIFMEVLSIPLMANAFLGLLFSTLLYIPLQYKRLLEEEKNNIRKMGEGYLLFMKETSAILPIKWLLSKNRRHL